MMIRLSKFLTPRNIFVFAVVLVVAGAWACFWWSRPSYMLVNESDRIMIFSVFTRGDRDDFTIKPRGRVFVKYAKGEFPDYVAFYPEKGDKSVISLDTARGTIFFPKTEDEERRGYAEGKMKVVARGFTLRDRRNYAVIYQEPPLSSVKGHVSVLLSSSGEDAGHPGFIFNSSEEIFLGFIVHQSDPRHQAGIAGYFKDAGWVGNDFPKSE